MAVLCPGSMPVKVPEPSTDGEDLFLGYGKLVVLLVGFHVAAVLFWIYLLWSSGKKPKKVATD